VASLIAVIVVASGAGLVSEGSRVPGVSSQSAALTSFQASAQPVSFDLDLVNTSVFSITLGFTAEFSMSGGSVSQGENLTADAAVAVPGDVDIDISYLGGTPVSVPISPIGSLYSLGIPGLSYSYLGLVQLGLFLNFSGVILANPSVSGPAVIQSAPLTWNSSSTLGLDLNVSSNAQDGATVVWTLGGISYGVSLGIDAIGTFLGVGLTIPLIDFGSLGLFSGTPDSISADYALPAPPSASGLGSLGNAAGLAEIARGVALVVVVGVVIAVVALRRRPPSNPGGPTPPQSSSEQSLSLSNGCESAVDSRRSLCFDAL
jgi:hypothetical protein